MNRLYATRVGEPYLENFGFSVDLHGNETESKAVDYTEEEYTNIMTKDTVEQVQRKAMDVLYGGLDYKHG